MCDEWEVEHRRRDTCFHVRLGVAPRRSRFNPYVFPALPGWENLSRVPRSDEANAPAWKRGGPSTALRTNRYKGNQFAGSSWVIS